MASLYFLHEVVEHYYEFDALLDNFELVVIPVANPGKISKSMKKFQDPKNSKNKSENATNSIIS